MVNGLVWLGLVLQLPAAVVPWVLLLAAVYLAGFFVSQLRTMTGDRYQAVAAYASVAAALGAVPLVDDHTPAVFLLLAVWLLVSPPLIETSVRTEAPGYAAASVAFSLIVVGTLVTSLGGRGAGLFEQVALLLAAAVTVAGVARYRLVERERREGRERYSALLSEYRDLKRTAARSADAARSEERMSVARRLHDSVGHKLTSLLMQLEADRLRSERLGDAVDDSRRRVEDLKRLAQESLDETRAAVTALSEDELMGMPALLRLINNLEVESAMRVEFTLGSGALNVSLEQAQSIALYRAVQEALTNAMRHGAARRAKVKVDVPGGRLVRFEVENEMAPGPRAFEPGFGLTTMRERVESAGGALEVMAGANTFLVRGEFPVNS